MSPFLRTLNNVTLRGRRRPRLAGVSCQIPPGVTAVVGDSGAGKSSLLNLLVGFETPDTGTITSDRSPPAGRLGVYWLPPGDGLWSHLSVRQHLEIVQPFPATSRVQIDELLSQFDLRALTESRPDDLSQGERARLAMTRALASQAEILVLDEPLIHTSVLRQPEYWRYTREFCSQHDISLVIASHDWELVGYLADHVLILEDGELRYSGPLEMPASGLTNSVAQEMLERICQSRTELQKTERLFKQNKGLG